MGNDKNNKCPLTDQIVSYMYGELHGKAEHDFETHLADCTACTDEFALVSESRYSVFEWKRKAFDPLPTPYFEVPAARQSSIPEKSFASAVMAWIQSLSAPVAVAAALAVVIGVWALVLTLGKKQEPSVAVTNTPQTVQPDRETDGTFPAPTVDVASRPDVAENKTRAWNTIKAVPVSTIRPRRAVKPPSMVAVKEPTKNLNTTPELQKAPALTAYQENDDQSLRLAELFDEVGG